MTYGIALGSNLGDRLGHLQAAMRELARANARIRIVSAAPVYETDPVDCPEGSQNFLNTVVEVTAGLEPLEMLETLHRVEARLGRPADHGHHAPRTVDLDLLYADDLALKHPKLTLPHPRLHLRRFVLQPLADIRPGLILPGQTQNVASLLATLDSPEPPLRLVTRDWLPVTR
jgi:2-amino-4-hydroxy-6-hydroxymethyldihydropteridine diphosphokinase